MTDSLRQRLFSRLVIDRETGCVLWMGATERGYGRIQVSPARRNVRVHRLMYEMFAGPIPPGMTIDHLCRVRNCANVAHMEVVTHRVNTLRGDGPTAANARTTHCPQGHEYDLLNTVLRSDGHRGCRECNKAKFRRYWARRIARERAQS